MHTIKVFVLQKFTVVVFKYFLIPENVTKNGAKRGTFFSRVHHHKK